MAARRKDAEPARPLALDPRHYPNAYWDGQVWRDGEFWYDEATADKAAAFFPKYCRLTEGEWAGKPFVLEAWQEHEIVRPLFGWKRADGTRRYRRAFVWVARKNGKTELAAGIALLMLLGDGEPGGQVYSIASEKEQAAIVFNKAATMVAYSPQLGALLDCLKPAIYCPSLNASFRPLSGKPQGKHGLNMSGLVGDEIHEWRSGDLYVFVHDSAAARRQPLEVLISTAGVKGTYGEQVYLECEAIAKGEIDDPETLVRIYAANDNDDWTDPETWKKGNPNLGVSVKVDALAAACRQAQQLPRLENDFKRYRLNMWTEQAVRWLPINAVDDVGFRFGWDHCIGPTPWNELEAKLAGLRCFGGLDLSAVQDLSALVWLFPVQPGLDFPTMLARFWKPQTMIGEHTKRDRVPYDQYVKMGALFTTPGNVLDHEVIRQQVVKDSETFSIAYHGQKREPDEVGLGIDPYDSTETLVKLGQLGLPVSKFRQGYLSMSPAAKAFERLVLSNGFHHGGHPLLRRHAQAVAIETDAAGNIKPSKDVSTLRIDGIVAACMAVGAAHKDTGLKTSVYEERGLRMAG